MLQVHKQIISSVTATTSSAVIEADQLFATSAIAVVSGTSPVGVLTLEASNDVINYPTVQPSNYVTIATVALSAVGNFAIPKTEICYKYIRYTFTKTSGTITTSVNMMAQAL